MGRTWADEPEAAAQYQTSAGVGSYISVIALTVLSTYPFYALVSSVQELDTKFFIPCTKDEPCRFSRLYGGVDLPGTFPDFVQMQNGVSRPILVDMKHSRAVPIPYKQPVARRDLVLGGYLLGGLMYQWPDEKNHVRKAHMWCAAFFCVDSSGKPFFALNGFSEEIEHAQRQVEKNSTGEYLDTHPGSARAVEQLNHAFDKVGYGRWMLYTVYPLAKSMHELFSFAMAWVHGQSTSSGSELLPSARCGLTPVPLGGAAAEEQVCSLDSVKKDIVNPLASSPAAAGYIACIGGWAFCKVAHDIMLLANWREVFSLHAGAASVLFAGGAVGMGFMTAMGASQVFIAHRDSADGEEPCACYYKLDDIPMLFMLATPCLLLWTYLKHLTASYRALLSGDYLYYEKFRVPYRWVRQNRGWTSASLLLDQLRGSSAKARCEEAPRLNMGYYVVLKLLGHNLTQMLLALPTVTAASSIFSRLMVYAAANVFRGHLINRAILALVLVGPGLACGYWFYHHVSTSAGKHESGFAKLACLMRDVFLRLGIAVLMWAPLCRLFSFQGPHHGPEFQAELTVHALLWEVASFPFVLDVVFGLLEDVVGCVQLRQVIETRAATDLCRVTGDCGLFMPFLLCDPTSVVAWKHENPEITKVYHLHYMIDQAERYLEQRGRRYMHWQHWDDWRDFLRKGGGDPETADYQPGSLTGRVCLADERREERKASDADDALSRATTRNPASMGSMETEKSDKPDRKASRLREYFRLGSDDCEVVEQGPTLLGSSPEGVEDAEKTPGKQKVEDAEERPGKQKGKWLSRFSKSST